MAVLLVELVVTASQAPRHLRHGSTRQELSRQALLLQALLRQKSYQSHSLGLTFAIFASPPLAFLVIAILPLAFFVLSERRVVVLKLVNCPVRK